MNKLDYLAQKEEELRKLNEALDRKQDKLEEKTSEVQNRGKDLFDNSNWVVNDPAEAEDLTKAEEKEEGQIEEKTEPDRSEHMRLLA